MRRFGSQLARELQIVEVEYIVEKKYLVAW